MLRRRIIGCCVMVAAGMMASAGGPAATVPATRPMSEQEIMIRRNELGTPAPEAVLKGHEDGVTSLEFSRDGAMLASGAGDGEIKLWSVAERKEAGNLPRQKASIRALSFSPNGERLVSSCADGTIVLWNVAERRIERAYQNPGLSNVAAFLPDGRHFVAAGADMLRLYTVGNPEPENLRVPGMDAIEMDVDGRGRVLVCSRQARVLLWNPLDPSSAAGKVLAEHERPELGMPGHGQQNYIYDARFTKDGNALVSDGLLWRWDLAKDEISPYASANGAIQEFRMHHDEKYFIYLNGSNLVSTNEDLNSTTWFFSTRERVNALAVSPRGDLVAVGHGGGWDDAGAWFPAGPTGIELYDLSRLIAFHEFDLTHPTREERPAPRKDAMSPSFLHNNIPWN